MCGAPIGAGSAGFAGVLAPSPQVGDGSDDISGPTLYLLLSERKGFFLACREKFPLVPSQGPNIVTDLTLTITRDLFYFRLYANKSLILDNITIHKQLLHTSVNLN